MKRCQCNLTQCKAECHPHGFECETFRENIPGNLLPLGWLPKGGGICIACAPYRAEEPQVNELNVMDEPSITL
jgi:hypothetical protein